MVPSSHCAVPTSHDCTFVTFDGSLIFFSHLMVSSSHCAEPTSHVIVLFHIWWFPYFFLTFDGTILTLCSTNITCNCTFVIFDGSLILFYFLVIFDGAILTLCSTNITCDRSFVTFSDSLNFFLTFDGSIITSGSTNITFDHNFATFSCTHIFSHIW